MICKNCGSQIDDKAVICVHCGKEVKKPFFKQPWFCVVAVIAAIVVFVALFAEPMPDDSAETVPTSPAQVEVIEISAEDLYTAYDQNAVGAEKKYDGKTLKVTGYVKNIGEDILGQTYITLDVGESLTSIQCYFEGEAIDGIIDLLEGDRVTLVGECSGKSLNIIIDDCTIVSSSTSSSATTEAVQATETPKEDTIEITAVDLFAAYDDNAVAADAKYKDKKLKVTGTVSNIGTDILDQVYVTLDTGEFLYTVQCYFNGKDAENKVAELSKGDEITVLGTCEGMTLNVTMRRCDIVG